MQKRLCILLIFVAAMILFTITCACADITDG